MKLTDLPAAGIAFVIIAVVLSVGATILTSLGTTQTGTAKDATLNGTKGLQTLAEWLPTIALVVAAAVVLGSLMAYFAFKE